MKHLGTHRELHEKKELFSTMLGDDPSSSKTLSDETCPLSRSTRFLTCHVSQRRPSTVSTVFFHLSSLSAGQHEHNHTVFVPSSPVPQWHTQSFPWKPEQLSRAEPSMLAYVGHPTVEMPRTTRALSGSSWSSIT